jgi:hypothetical protein
MKGAIKKERNYPFGVKLWVDLWQKDAVDAIGDLGIMNDRYSYPGDRICDLVEYEVVDKKELEEAIYHWLTANTPPWKKNDPFLVYYKMVEVAAVARRCNFKKICTWFVEHFEEMWKIIPPSEWESLWHDEIIITVLSGDFHSIDSQLRQILQTEEFHCSWVKQTLSKKLSS